MKNVIELLRDPSFGRIFYALVAVAVAFHTVSLLMVVFREKDAETYLYKAADAFDGIATGWGCISFVSFIQNSWIIGTVSCVLALVFAYFDRKFTSFRHNKDTLAKIQKMLDTKTRSGCDLE